MDYLQYVDDLKDAFDKLSNYELSPRDVSYYKVFIKSLLFQLQVCELKIIEDRFGKNYEFIYNRKGGD